MVRTIIWLGMLDNYKRTTNRLEATEMWLWRQILKILWRHKISNEDKIAHHCESIAQAMASRKNLLKSLNHETSQLGLPKLLKTDKETDRPTDKQTNRIHYQRYYKRVLCCFVAKRMFELSLNALTCLSMLYMEVIFTFCFSLYAPFTWLAVLLVWSMRTAISA